MPSNYNDDATQPGWRLDGSSWNVMSSAIDTSKNFVNALTATTTELNYTDGVTSNIQTQLNAKQATLVSGTNIKTVNSTSLVGSGDVAVQATITGGATTIASDNLTASRILQSDGSGKVAVVDTATYPSLTELSYVKGVTSALQTQLNAKAPIADPTFTGEIGIGAVNVSETELGILEGALVTTTELNYLDNVTSSVQTQLNAKQPLDAALTALATGSDFVVFSGPASSNKTFTLPNASSTILTSNAAVTVAQGGTGRATSTTAYGLIAAGTTATGAHQTLAAGATTEVLVGGGASALPVWTAATGSGAPVRATSPTLVTPNIGVAQATSLDMNNGNITEIKQAIYNGIIDDGNSGTADTIDFSTGSIHKSTLTGNVEYTFTAPSGVSRVQLLMYTGSGSFAVTFPATVKWVGGTAPTITTAASKVDIATFLWDGTNYWGSITQNYSA
jgi:hypothetical protein